MKILTKTKQTLAKVGTLAVLYLVPFVVRAQDPPTPCADPSCATDSLGSLFSYFSSMIRNYILPLLFTGAMIFFIIGIIRLFLVEGDNQAKRAEGRKFMLWGLVSMFVIFAIWGILGVVFNTFGITPGGTLPVPNFET